MGWFKLKFSTAGDQANWQDVSYNEQTNADAQAGHGLKLKTEAGWIRHVDKNTPGAKPLRLKMADGWKTVLWMLNISKQFFFHNTAENPINGAVVVGGAPGTSRYFLDVEMDANTGGPAGDYFTFVSGTRDEPDAVNRTYWVFDTTEKIEGVSSYKLVINEAPHDIDWYNGGVLLWDLRPDERGDVDSFKGAPVGVQASFDIRWTGADDSFQFHAVEFGPTGGNTLCRLVAVGDGFFLMVFDSLTGTVLHSVGFAGFVKNTWYHVEVGRTPATYRFPGDFWAVAQRGNHLPLLGSGRIYAWDETDPDMPVNQAQFGAAELLVVSDPAAFHVNFDNIMVDFQFGLVPGQTEIVGQGYWANDPRYATGIPASSNNFTTKGQMGRNDRGWQMSAASFNTVVPGMLDLIGVQQTVVAFDVANQMGTTAWTQGVLHIALNDNNSSTSSVSYPDITDRQKSHVYQLPSSVLETDPYNGRTVVMGVPFLGGNIATLALQDLGVLPYVPLNAGSWPRYMERKYDAEFTVTFTPGDLSNGWLVVGLATEWQRIDTLIPVEVANPHSVHPSIWEQRTFGWVTCRVIHST